LPGLYKGVNQRVNAVDLCLADGDIPHGEATDRGVDGGWRGWHGGGGRSFFD
jgi:hypothetical protein